MVWLTIIGSASIQIRADDKYFEPDVRRAVGRLKNVEIQLKADTDISKASKKIRDLRYRITSKDAILKIDANLAKAEEKMAKFLAKFVDKELIFTATANTQGANSALTKLRDRFVATRVPFTATANTAAASAALAFTARNRTSRITAFIDPTSQAALKGMFNTLTGTLPFDKVRAAISALAANFEGIVVKTGLVTSALGALSAAALTAGGNLFSIAADVGQAGGLLALLPTALFSLVAVLKVNKMAWDGFGDAAKDNSAKANEALAKLPPEAQKAALALRGVREQIQKPVQKAFWEAAGDSLQRMVAAQLPSVIAGLSTIGASMGGFSAEVFDVVAGLDFSEVFVRIATSIDRMKEGLRPAITGLAEFVNIGSQYLPQFGDWVADLGKKFGDFAKNASESGEMISWINMGIQRAKELGTVVSATAGIFVGLSNAARTAGSAGLTDMANGLRDISLIVNSEPFQSRLVSILEGAREGTRKLGAGLRTLTDLFSENADAVGLFLDKAGEVAGLTFENITAMFDGTGLGSGLMDALDGLSDGLDIMKPGFSDLGKIIGDLGEIAGELFRSMAPGLNMLTDTLSGVVGGLKDGVMAAMPVLNEFVQSILQLASGPIVAIAEGIGALLEVFADLPGFIQIAIASLVGFILLKPKLDAMWTGVRSHAAAAFAGLAADVDTAGVRTQTAFGRSADAIRAAWKGVGTELSEGRQLSGYFTNMQRLESVTKAAAGAIGTTAGQGLRMAGSGLMSALGGPWGAALGAAAVAVGLFAAEQAEAKAEVDGLAAALEQQSGAFSLAADKMLTEKVLDINANWWDDLARSGRRNMEELVDAADINMKEVNAALSNPEGREDFLNNWRNVRDAMGDGAWVTAELAASVNMTQEQLKGLSDTDLSNIVSQFEKGARMAQEAEEKVKSVSTAMGTNSIVSAQLAKNYDTLKSSSSSAGSKLSALKENLDLLNNGATGARIAAREYTQSLADQQGAIKDLVETHGGVIESTGRINDAFRNTLLNADNTFSNASQGARDFSVQMDSAAESILKQGTAELDRILKTGASMPEAMAGAMSLMQPAVDTLRGTLATLGFDAEQINGIISQLGLDPEKLTAAMSVDTKQAEVDVARLKLAMTTYADGNYTAVLAALPQAAKDAIADTMGLGEEFASGNYEAILSTLDKTAGGKEAALASLLTFEGTDWVAFLKAQNLIPEEVAKANAAADLLTPEKTTVLKAQDLATMTVEAANAYVLGDKRNKLSSDDLVTEVLNTINNSPLGDKQNTLSAKDLVTQMVNDVNAKQLNNKLNELETRDLVSAVVDQVNRMTLNGKSNTLTANDLATAVINAVNSKIINDKTFTITAYHRSIGEAGQARDIESNYADGGIVNGAGIQTFADGGIFNRAIKAYASGGTENHVAQIARGAWPVRVWAEPETGGEAYLPLHPSKRKRSLEILRQVMQEFGLNRFIQFDNGGVMVPRTTYSSPDIVSSRYANTISTISQVGSMAPTGPNIAMNVFPSERMDEMQIGESAAKSLYWQFLNR